MRFPIQTGLKRAGVVAAAAGVAYATVSALTWYRFGRKRPRDRESTGATLDAFIPDYEVREHHCIAVNAPSVTTFGVACGLNLQQSSIVRTLFRLRELLFNSAPDGEKSTASGLLEQAKLWGWGVLAEDPGREIVFGAVTQPWLARPVFHAQPPSEFATFREQGYAKIAWALRVDPIDATRSIASTETRVATTDAISRVKFRRYWAFAMPGSVLIRIALLRLVKKRAEARAQEEVATGVYRKEQPTRSTSIHTNASEAQ